MLPDSSLLSSPTASATHKSSFHSSLLNSSNASSNASSSSSQATSLKVVIVGNEGVGKTSFVRRFVSEELGIPIDDVTPTASSSVCSLSSPSPIRHHQRLSRERPPGTISTGVPQNPEVGLDIYELELPLADVVSRDTGTLPIEGSDDVDGGSSNGNLHRLSIWDFSGKAEVQKLFFTPQTLYVVLWDMAAKDVTPLQCECANAAASGTSGHDSSLSINHSQNSIKHSAHNVNSGTNNNSNASRSQSHRSARSSTFNLGYDSDSDSSEYNYYNDCDVDMYNQEELRVVKRKLEKDIDKKVQCWIDRIQAIAPGATILPMATHMNRFRPKNLPDLKERTTLNTNATTFTTEEYQQKEVKKRCWLLKERLISNESRKVEGFKERLSTASDSNPSNSFTENLSRPNFQFGNVQKDGQVFPHAVAASCNCDEDKERDDGSIDDMLLELKTKSGYEFEYEYEQNFSSARDFILCTALTSAAREKRGTRQEPGRVRRNLTAYPQNYFIGIHEQSVPASLATVMLRDVRQKLWHRSKIVQTNYFTEKFETGEHDREASNNSHRGDQDYNNTNNNSAVLTALNSLHLSGELCYFGDVIPSSEVQHQERSPDMQLLSDFVVLDPTWLIESIDFILQYAKQFVQNTTNSQTAIEFPNSSNQYRATNCPTIDQEEVRRLWKSRYSTKQGLGLAEHYHQFQHSDQDERSENGVADRVFEFIQYLLIRHDIFIPLSYQKSGSTHFFLPCLLHQKKAPRTNMTNSSQSTLLLSGPSILQDLTHSNNLIPENERYADSQINLDCANLQAACHGFVFVDTAPEMLMERVIVHTIKSLRDILSTNCKPIIKPERIYFWKDSFRLKLRVDKGEDQSVELNSVLLEAPGCGANSRIITCESMLVTYVQGCNNAESKTMWRQTCLRLREAMKNALDEIPGIEYREEGICPHCLRKKFVSDTGTWTLSKLQSAVNNREAFVRCRHGHRTETKLNGLLHCQLVDVPGEYLAKNDIVQNTASTATGQTNSHYKPQPSSLTTLISSKNQSSCGTSSPKGAKRNFQSAVKIIEPDKILCSGSKRHITKTKNKMGISFCDSMFDGMDIVSSSVDDVAKAGSTTIISDAPLEREPNNNEAENQISKENNRVFNSKVTLLLDRCKAKMERLFLKKNHLGLDNRNMTECQIPMEKLIGTKFGHYLQSLSLSHNKLDTLPQSLVRCLPNLRSMNLSHCLIYELPKRWNIPLLKKLDISHNILIGFPEEVSQ
jgi:GTPase SAR1 family protein